MKKSILTLLLALLLALGLAACGGGAAVEPAEEESTETTEPAEAEEAEENTEETASAEGASKLVAVYDSMDPEAGIHMVYDVYLESLGTTRYDVHTKGGTYYARQSMQKEGYEDYDSVKFIQDGVFYTLHVKDQDGISMKGPSTDKAIITDSVYSGIQLCKDRTDFTAGQTEVDGTTYDSETFPVSAASPMEQTFCFDGDGNLAVYIAAASEQYSTPEVKYTILSIDDQVDESLFDISGYTIEEQ